MYTENIKIIIENVNISDVVALFLKIEKRERFFVSLCPFHVEKTPSFFISDEKKFYYCFGCLKHGDVINFLIEYKKFTFLEAIDFLKSFKKIKFLQEDINIDYYNILEKIKNVYAENLIKSVKNNTFLANFLLKRNLSSDILREFEIGFAPEKWDFILNTFKINNKINILKELGIIKEKNNKCYDVFRNRIIFPIKNKCNKVVGFGGRALDNIIKPKYINSKESKVFIKSNELYGLNILLNQNEIQDTIFLVEGYMDVISFHKNNIKNAVGLLGTNLSDNQFNILKKKYKNIIICLDGDSAGMKASFNIAKKFLSSLEENLYIGFIKILDNKDPDYMLNSNSRYDFINSLSKPLFILDYIFEILSINKNIVNINEKIKITNEISKITENIKNKKLKDIITDYFSEKILLKNQIHIVKKITVLSLFCKASAFLIKKKYLIDEIKNDDIKYLSMIDNEEAKILLNVINLLKKDVNMKIDYQIISKLNINKSYFNLIDLMNKDEAKIEFISLMEKIKME